MRAPGSPPTSPRRAPSRVSSILERTRRSTPRAGPASGTCSRSSASEQDSEDRRRGEELSPGGDATLAVPAGDAVAREELALANSREDVLEVGCRGCEGSDRDGAQRAVSDEKRQGAGDAASDLELARRDVAVRNRVPERVQDRPERERSPPRARESAGRPAGRDVEGDDQERNGVSSSRGAGWPFSVRRRSMSSDAAARDSGNSSPNRSHSAAA